MEMRDTGAEVKAKNTSALLGHGHAAKIDNGQRPGRLELLLAIRGEDSALLAKMHQQLDLPKEGDGDLGKRGDGEKKETKKEPLRAGEEASKEGARGESTWGEGCQDTTRERQAQGQG